MKMRNILRTSTAFVLIALLAFLLPVQAAAQALTKTQTSADGQTIQTESTQEIAVAQQKEKPAEILAEINGKRDRFTKHFRLDNGSFMAVQYEYPVHYQDAEGNWVEYNNTLQEKQIENTREEMQTQPVGESVLQQTTLLPETVHTEPEDPSEGVSYIDENEPSTENELVTENIDALQEESTAPQGQTQAATDAPSTLSIQEDRNETEYAPKKSDLDIRLSNKAKKNNMVRIQSDGYQVSWPRRG